MAKRQGSGLRYVMAGFALMGLSKVIEIRGDAAPYAAEGGSGERLFCHGLTLLVLLGALACFLRAGYLAFRKIFKRDSTVTEELVALFADNGRPQKDAADEGSFDPDAAMARYLERKQAVSQTSGLDGTRPPTGIFGRKRT